ncbi:glycosyltransferase family 2 protein [Paracoccus laeviglucosivorans]|uniref:Glycosyltransferase, GT2 family n=1 Tax=Paracoccus laeviglucosivorans TaxID=1197861 RepID=A0A521DBP7_9RHOB|nr:glycosyltransferase family A protein [Paracoccus laeviglucosivorans]SMO69066.1 Glycosyltransferase, GT2 family [Paracoccus laeviglucosivorans]
MSATTENTSDHDNAWQITAAVSPQQVTAIAIGRNEGERLIRCLASLLPQVGRVIYVDSGSTDGSAARALEMGAEVVQLDMTKPFTAARARNAGFVLTEGSEFVQFVDGDCEVEQGWIATALAAMAADPKLAITAGRRRERKPEASIYNRLCDTEWDTPIGPAQAVGGDMLVRRAALAEIGGFDPTLIAGEEPEMCLRIARAGWVIRRLDAPMTLHDAAMTRYDQWARRSRRAGHAFAEVSWRYRDGAERFWQRETRRSVIWALILPLLILLGLIVTPWALVLLLAYPAQIARMAMRDPDARDRWPRAFYTMLGKFPEARGVLEFHLRRLLGRRSGLIEYK